MRHRFDAGAAKIEPGDRALIDHDEAVIAFGRDIHMPVARQGRCRDEEHFLCLDELDELVIEFLIRLAHDCLPSACELERF